MSCLSLVKKVVPHSVRRKAWDIAERFPDPMTFRPRRYALPLVFHKYRMLGGLEHHIQLLDELCGSRKLALDIGANIGMYTYALSRICERVVAFEPNPLVAEVIQSYRRRNIIVHGMGLSSVESTFELHVPVVEGVPHYGSATLSHSFDTEELRISVPVKRLDDFEFTGLSFVKIDCEGHEEEVLRGGEATFRRERPNLLIEIEQRHLQKPITEIFGLLKDWGYEGSFMCDGAEHPVSEFAYETHQRPYLGHEYRPEYVNNFIFRHPASR